MKKHFKTVIIGVLLVTSVFLAEKIWLAAPPGPEELLPKAQPKIAENIEPRVLPASMLVNFGDGKHTKIYQLQNLWPFYRNILKRSSEINEKVRWESVGTARYLKLHEEPSVVFDLENAVYSDLLKKMYNLDDIEEDIRQLYFSESEGMLVVTDNGIFKPRVPQSYSDIETYISSVAKENLPSYSSLWERYGIPRAVYLPDGAAGFAPGHIYRNELSDMPAAYKNDLVQRLLKVSIDDIHVIGEEDSVLYVAGQKSVRLFKNGILEYRNGGESQGSGTDAASAVQTAMAFTVRATGNGDSLYVKDVVPVRDNGRGGYRVSLNFFERGIGVVPVDGRIKNYVEAEIYDNQVRSFRYIYRNNSGERVEDEPVSTLSVDEIVAKNPNVFGDPARGYNKILKDVRDFGLCYIDYADHPRSKLRYGYTFRIDDEDYLFDAQTGAYIGGERE